ncbi:MAG: hydrogenase formation protein HypD [archaeon]|nr:hydrogenase formation protein HypD [archaeon]MCP8314308.1 hydrogenase formation protein HypD [archaeon]
MTKGYRDKELISKLAELIRREASNGIYKFMHVCGTHEDTITKHGLRAILPSNIDVVAGPGCPVCVTHPERIELALKLLEERSNVTLTTFGDMYRVPSRYGRSFSHAKAKGFDVKVVYSISDAIKMAKDNGDKEVVHFAVGFETTAPSTASSLLQDPPKNFSIISAHLAVPPVLDHLLASGEITVQGLILPGHVSTIIGFKAYEFLIDRYKVPQVVAGFEPLDVIVALRMLLRQVKEGEIRVENEYGRVVKSDGNLKAKKLMNEVFKLENTKWRGLGKVPNSGLQLKPEFEQFDAVKKFDIEPPEITKDIESGCRCSDVIKGLVNPQECRLFGRVCTPYDPRGPCMVSIEGTCAIAYKYGGLKFKN